MTPRRESGAATVEHAGLSLLIAVVAAVVIAAVGSADDRGAGELGPTIARKLRCAAVGPGPCWRDPLTEAYGRRLAGAVRALSPAPLARAGPGGLMLPVDFRRCRSPGCAAPGPNAGLTASNRRVTDFVSVGDGRPGGAPARIDYWLYRPGQAWERVTRLVTPERIAALASTPLRDDAVPVLVALETLDGRNQYEFPGAEEPPWRWRIESAYP